jgi:hypothetical protein
MTSFATAGAGAKAVTAIMPARSGYTVGSYNNSLVKTQSVAVAADTPTVVLDITSSGVLQFSGFGGNGQSNTSSTIVIEMDGVTVMTSVMGSDSASYISCQVGMYQAYSNTTGLNVAYLEHLPFNTSLKVTATSVAGASTYHYRYFLT